MTTNNGDKHDKGKPAYHLIDSKFNDEVIGDRLVDAGTGPSAEWLLHTWAADGEAKLLQRAFSAVVAKFNTDNLTYTARIELARVLEFGCRGKYAPTGWRKGFKWSRLWRSAYAHIEAHKSGDIYDRESGLLHLSHALSQLMFLIVHERDGLGEDDRDQIWAGVPKPGAISVTAANGHVFRLGECGATISHWWSREHKVVLHVPITGGHTWPDQYHPVPTSLRDSVTPRLLKEMRVAVGPQRRAYRPEPDPRPQVLSNNVVFVLTSTDDSIAEWETASGSRLRIPKDPSMGYSWSGAYHDKESAALTIYAVGSMRAASWPSISVTADDGTVFDLEECGPDLSGWRSRESGMVLKVGRRSGHAWPSACLSKPLEAAEESITPELLKEMRAAAWPSKTKQISVTTNLGHVFDLQECDATLSVWRAAESRALLQVSSMGVYVWLDGHSSTPVSIDRSAVTSELLKKMRAAAWPSK